MGYGYGVGLFLKPQAAEALQQSMQKAQGMLWPHEESCQYTYTSVQAPSNHYLDSHFLSMPR